MLVPGIRVLQVGLHSSCCKAKGVLYTAVAWLQNSCFEHVTSFCALSGGRTHTMCQDEVGIALILALTACMDYILPYELRPASAKLVMAIERTKLLDVLLRRKTWSDIASSEWSIFQLWNFAARSKSRSWNLTARSKLDVVSCFSTDVNRGLVATAVLEGLTSYASSVQRASALAALASYEPNHIGRAQLLHAAQNAVSLQTYGPELALALESHEGVPLPALDALALVGCRSLRQDLRLASAESWRQSDGISAMLLGPTEIVEQARLRALTFDSIYHLNAWTVRPPSRVKGEATASGGGSFYYRTRVSRACIGQWLRHYDVTSVLDIGCGDANWQASVRGFGTSVRYKGIDISSEAIRRAATRKQNAMLLAENFSFSHGDPMLGLPPTPDGSPWQLVMMIDIMMHLSAKDILRIVHMLHVARVKYFLASHHVSLRNKSLTFGPSQWKTMSSPAARRVDPAELFFPPPLQECIDKRGSRVHSLWLVSDLPRGNSMCLWPLGTEGKGTFESCCDERLGLRGNLSCWDSNHTFEYCCQPSGNKAMQIKQ